MGGRRKVPTTRSGNPNPVQTEAFKERIQQPLSKMPDEPLAKQAVAVKLGQSVYEKLMKMDRRERITLMRRAISEAVNSTG